jgi:hypothetical protein
MYLLSMTSLRKQMPAYYCTLLLHPNLHFYCFAAAVLLFTFLLTPTTCADYMLFTFLLTPTCADYMLITCGLHADYMRITC